MSDSRIYVPVATCDIEALKKYIKTDLHVSSFKENKELSPEIPWRPTLQHNINKYTTIAYEINEKVYPPIISYSRMDVVNTNKPISVYSVCPEENLVKNMPEMRKLQKDGFGLITIDENGNVTKHCNAIPLAQFIPRARYDSAIKDLPNSIRQRISSAYEIYNNNPIGGLEELTKIVEAISIQVAKKLKDEGKLNGNLPGSLAGLLHSMGNANSLSNSQVAAVGGFHSYVKRFRNPSHHEPKSKSEAKRLLSNCEAGFTEGLSKILDFNNEFKKLGIKIRL